MMLLSFGTLAFWVCAFIVTVFCLVSVANEWPGRTTLGLATFLVAVHFLGGGLGLLPWIVAHGPETLALVAGYFLVGALWSVLKWFLFVKRLSWAYVEQRIQFIKREMPGLNPDEKMPVPSALRRDWQRRTVLCMGRHYGVESIAGISVRDHKARIMIWIAYWPFSMAYTLIDDPLRWLVRMLYEKLTGVFRAVAARIMDDINASNDMQLPPPPFPFPSTPPPPSLKADEPEAWKVRGRPAK